MSGLTASRARKRRPSPAEERRLLAEAGDVNALWDRLTQSDWATIDGGDTFRCLLRALEVRAGLDPAGLSAEMFSRMMAFSSFLWMRGAYAIRQTLYAVDQANQGSRPLPRELTEEQLPHLLDIQHHLAELALAQASTARLWELARLRKREADRPSLPLSRTVARGMITRSENGEALVIESKTESYEMAEAGSNQDGQPAPSLEGR
jgi:hypothetical protein